jgi:hypothetical protein
MPSITPTRLRMQYINIGKTVLQAVPCSYNVFADNYFKSKGWYKAPVWDYEKFCYEKFRHLETIVLPVL